MRQNRDEYWDGDAPSTGCCALMLAVLICIAGALVALGAAIIDGILGE